MRLIDADAFALFIVDHLPRTAPQEVYDAYFDVMRMLKDEKATPTADVVEVVRCKDCKYCEQYADLDTDRLCNYGCGLGYLNGNSYCSYGERREKGNDES